MREAVILAAGEGRRLKPLTLSRPKVMLSIAGKPVLQYVIEALAKNGVSNIILVVGYHKEQIFNHFGSGERFGVDITYITQEKQLGTAHALFQTREKVGESFLVLQGDKLIDAETIASFIQVEPVALLTKRVENPQRYDRVVVSGGLLESISIATEQKEGQDNLVSTGVYALSKAVFDFDAGELELPSVLGRMAAQGIKVKVYETDGTWLDVVYPWDILNINDALLKKIPSEIGGTVESGVTFKKPVQVGREGLLCAGSYIAGPVIVGERCHIGPHVCIMPSSSIGSNVVISPFCLIKNSVIGDDVSIGPGSVIENSIIDRGCIIEGHFMALSGKTEVKVEGGSELVEMGVVVGEGCHIGGNVVAQPGSIIGNYCQVKAQRLLSGYLPDGSLVV